MSSRLLQRCIILWMMLLIIAFFAYPQNLLQIGYALLTPDGGSAAPVANALLRAMNDEGVLVSETSVPAVTPVRSGLIYIDGLETRTGLAFVNPSSQPADVTLSLRNTAGVEAARQVLSIGPHAQFSQFAEQLFGPSATNLRGSLGFQSNQQVAVVGFRQSFNARHEVIYTTVSVTDPAIGETTPAVIPFVRSGNGYLSAVILLNRSDQRARGLIRLRGDTQTDSQYDIPAKGIQRMEIGESGPQTGYVEVTADPGSVTPGAMAFLQLNSADGVVSETIVPQVTASRGSRVLIESDVTQTQLSLANPNIEPADTTFTLLDRFGATVSSVTRNLPPEGFLFLSADELFSTLSSTFLGQIEIESSVPISTIAIRANLNSRRDSILASLQVANLALGVTNALVVPNVVIGGGFSTRLIFINGQSDVAAAGQVAFLQSNGDAMRLPVTDATAGGDGYQLPARGVRQLFPGNLAPAADVSLRDPASNTTASELTINEGQAVRPNLLVIDSAGTVRDDFRIALKVTNPEVASIDSSGAIVGRSAGFSTLTIDVGGQKLQPATVTVVEVDSGIAGYGAGNVRVDSAGRLYMVSSEEHAILITSDLHQPPTVWAGTPRANGFKDDARLSSQFYNPADLAKVSDTVYVSDSSNHAIRQIRSGDNGRVTTIAGNGVAGAQDGAETDATFRNPRGVAYDNRGFLWVTDTGNHTIRRIDLLNKQVKTVAGRPGESGLANGRGADALFRSPTAIAFEPEPKSTQLAPGYRPRPVQMIVADTGNGVIRRIIENGDVETIGQAALLPLSMKERRLTAPGPAGALTFNNPVGVTLDTAGTIYVAEEGGVRAILQNGSVVRAAQTGTITQPKGLAITDNGRLLVSDGKVGLQQIRYGEPQITSVTPKRITNRGKDTITIRGRNFAPETIIVLAGTVIRDVTIADTETIVFTAPPELESGRTTLTLQNRGGLKQLEFLIDPISLDALPPGSITTLAGGSTFAGDGGPAIDASVALPEQVAIDAAGDIYVADTGNNRVRKVDHATGIITTVAGSGGLGCSGDKRPAVAAKFKGPAGVALDKSGNLFIADTGNGRIRKVDAVTGVISTIAGRESPDCDQPPDIPADLNAPRGLAFDADGSLYIADSTNHIVRKLTTAGLTTFAGIKGLSTYQEDGVPAALTALNSPRAVAVDSLGNVFIADTFNGRIRRVDSAGIIQTIARNLNFPQGVAVGVNGDVLISDSENHRILRVDRFGNLAPVAGTGTPGFSGEGGNPVDAKLNEPHGIAVDGAGTVIVADHDNNIIRKIAEGGQRVLTPVGIRFGPTTITTIAGNGSLRYLGDGGPATFATLVAPSAVVSDAFGNLFIADAGSHRVRRVDRATGVITTIAGVGRANDGGDDGPAAEAFLNSPGGLAIDGEGSLYIADTFNHKIRRVDANGVIHTVAATGLRFPTGLAIDRQNNLYIADQGNHLIRKVAAATGVMTIVAGNGSTRSLNDGRLATEASLNQPGSVAVDAAGNLYIADSGNNRIRRVDSRTQLIDTIAGPAALNFPLSVAIDRAGDVLIVDTFNDRLLQLQVETGVIRTIAGTGAFGFSGDNGPATAAMLWTPTHVAIDPAGNVLVADSINQRIRGIVISSQSR